MTTVSLRMEELGNHTEAWGICEEALKTASEYDWHPRIGGGSKIAAARALRKLDQGRAVPLIWETLLGDLRDAESLIGTIPEIMEDLTELLAPSMAVTDAWDEIEIHTTELLGGTYFRDLSAVFDEYVTVDNAHRSMVDLIMNHLGHPCYPVVQAAQRCLGLLLLERSDYVAEVLLEALEQSGECQERALMVIDAVSTSDPDVADRFRSIILQLTHSSSCQVRRISRTIIANCGWPQPGAMTLARPLPAVYQLTNPVVHRGLALPDDVDYGQRSVGESLDAARGLAPFGLQLKIIADAADVSTHSLRQRVIELMHDVAPEETVWSAEAERALQSDLRSVGTRIAYARPQVRVARTAIFLAVAELADGGRISRHGNNILRSVLRTYDPRMVLERPSHRPPQIPGMTLLDKTADEESWVRDAAKALSSTHWTPDRNRSVLAEVTNLEKRRNRFSLTETRYAVLNHGRPIPQDLETAPHLMFGGVMGKLVSEYQQLGSNPKTRDLVIFHSEYWIDTPGCKLAGVESSSGCSVGLVDCR